MSLKGTIEILVHFGNFRNIDLFHQGVYQLRATIFKKTNQGTQQQAQFNIQMAQPYMILEETAKKDVPKKQPLFGNLLSKNQTDHFIQGSRMHDTEFWSKAFVVKYCDETVDLNDGCVFRFEIEAFPDLKGDDCYFQVELMFTELSTLTQEDYKAEYLKSYMKPVAKFESKINNIFQGIREAVPIQFDEMHFCVIKATVHSLLIDFKFRQTLDSINVQGETFDQFLRRVTHSCILFFSIGSKVQRELVDDFFDGYVRALQNTYGQFVSHHKKAVHLLKDPVLRQKFLDVVLTPYFPQFTKREIKLEESLLALSTEESKQQQYVQKDIKISNYFNLSLVKDQLDLCQTIILEINHLSSLLFNVWYQFLDMFDHVKGDLAIALEKEYIIRIKDRWGESIFKSEFKLSDLSSSPEQGVGRKHKSMAQLIRGKEYYQSLEPQNIEDLNLFPRAKIHPILFKEVYILDPPRQPLKPLKGVHMIVLAHGYQGNSFDMRLWRNILAVKYPEHVFLSVTCNEDNTEQDIMYMGQKLAEEVKRWIKDWFPKNQFEKLSFIGHSLGGLIIRAALPHLEAYKEKMQTILTMGTPHLGYIPSTSAIVGTGLWFIKKWKNCICLTQLTLSDNKNPEQTCLYKLSQDQGLGWFRNVILVSSYQDSYVPFESARIQRTTKVGNNDKGKAYDKMIDNLLKQLTTDKIERLDVNYEIVGRNLDNMIGRAAHIAFLENQALIKLIIYSFDGLFD